MLEWSLDILWEICNIFIHALYVSWMHFLAYSIPISPGKIEKNESFETYTAISLMNFLRSIWIRSTENYQYTSITGALSKSFRVNTSEKLHQITFAWGKKFAALPNPAARLTSVSFIFLIRRFERKRQTVNGTNGTSVRSAKRYNFSIYTRAWSRVYTCTFFTAVAPG